MRRRGESDVPRGCDARPRGAQSARIWGESGTLGGSSRHGRDAQNALLEIALGCGWDGSRGVGWGVSGRGNRVSASARWVLLSASWGRIRCLGGRPWGWLRARAGRFQRRRSSRFRARVRRFRGGDRAAFGRGKHASAGVHRGGFGRVVGAWSVDAARRCSAHGGEFWRVAGIESDGPTGV